MKKKLMKIGIGAIIISLILLAGCTFNCPNVNAPYCKIGYLEKYYISPAYPNNLLFMVFGDNSTESCYLPEDSITMQKLNNATGNNVTICFIFKNDDKGCNSKYINTITINDI